jgi:hypothetical protein
MIIKSLFKPAWWLRNRHAQTIYATLMRHLKAPIDRIEPFELPDGDVMELAWVDSGLSSDAPLVILLHGLGGGVESKYVAGQLRSYHQRGFRAVLMCFRGSGQAPNRLPRAYHSGDTDDLDYLLRTLAHKEPYTKKAIVGISLGGNVGFISGRWPLRPTYWLDQRIPDFLQQTFSASAD